MKLHNKKTGEIGYLELEKCDNEKYIGLRVYLNDFIYKRYSSLDKLNEEWEDYTPKEPLIKNEKIRKLVKIWAKVNELDEVIYDGCKDYIYAPDCDNLISISFSNYYAFDGLEHRKLYTITELCGE